MGSDLKIVVGIGKTGISCIRYLTKQGANLAVVDSRPNPPGLDELQQSWPKIPTYLGGFDEVILSQAQELIISPGVSLSEPAITACLKRGVKIAGDIELFTRATKVPIVAITGSNGKSTVTSLVGEMAKAAKITVGIGGNLGAPALDLLDQNANFYILELSSFQLETTFSLKAKAATLLNISPDHMDRYQNLNEYLRAKQRIYANCDTAIINRDDSLCYTNIKLPPKVISFGNDQPESNTFGIKNGCLMYGGKKLITLKELKIKGLHNAANALAALALGTAIDLPLLTMVQVLYEFPGLPHRCQWVANIKDSDWYNDSKGTNVGATKASIEGLGESITGKIILIAGGLGKNADFFPLHDTIAKYVKTMVLIGKNAPVIKNTLVDTTKILFASSMKEAVTICAKEATSKDAVLLSPACASFDMFNNFEHRGEVFMEEVKKL